MSSNPCIKLPLYRDNRVYGWPLAGELEQGLLLAIFRGPWLVYASDIAIGSTVLAKTRRLDMCKICVETFAAPKLKLISRMGNFCLRKCLFDLSRLYL